MFKRMSVCAVFAAALMAQQVGAENLAAQPHADKKEEAPRSKAKEFLTDVVIAGIIITASITAYKTSGRPCACPDDMMRNGRRCGGNSAWSRASGARPLCYVTDISKGMIDAYRATKAIPALR